MKRFRDIRQKQQKHIQHAGINLSHIVTKKKTEMKNRKGKKERA